MSFWEEFKRRKVGRVTVAYAVIAWLLVEIVVTVEAPLNLPGWMDTFVIVLVLVGFPLALVLSWLYDLTPTGIERTKHLESSAEMSQEQDAPLIVLPLSLAVLPFVNMSDDPQQEYFSDGVTEDIITDLSLIPGLFVIARNSTFTYKGKSVDLRRLGEEMGVRYVLEGGVRKSGNQVRVTARLVEAVSGRQLWAKKYDRSLESVFAVQDELTKEIVTALDVELISGERGRHQRSRVKNPEAREALYRGMAQFYKFDPASHSQAKAFFEQFTQLEPDSILGYVWQAQMCQVEIFMGWGEDRDLSLRNMEEFRAKALKIDDKDPLALGHAGMHQLFLGNHDQSITFAKQALAAAPGMDSPYYSLGWFQMFNETPLQGIENLKRAMRLSPVVTAPRATILGTAYRNAGQLELAVATLENSVQRFPEFLSGRVALASCYALMGEDQKAKQEAREILRRDPAYTIARYTTPNLYRNKETMEKWAESLRKAGIPD
jgi:adenylate cyclase